MAVPVVDTIPPSPEITLRTGLVSKPIPMTESCDGLCGAPTGRAKALTSQTPHLRREGCPLGSAAGIGGGKNVRRARAPPRPPASLTPPSECSATRGAGRQNPPPPPPLPHPPHTTL